MNFTKRLLVAAAASSLFVFNMAAAQKLAASCGAVARTTQDIIADPTIDAVLIATSTDTHSNLIEAAAAAGKQLMLRKLLGAIAM